MHAYYIYYMEIKCVHVYLLSHLLPFHFLLPRQPGHLVNDLPHFQTEVGALAISASVSEGRKPFLEFHLLALLITSNAHCAPDNHRILTYSDSRGGFKLCLEHLQL